MVMLLGCIGDDFTGSGDLANTLARQGMRTTLFAGTPREKADEAIEAGVVALKSRTIPPKEAVALSLEALEWLRGQGCAQILFKYCSTFDSTPHGNIGPVIDALADVLGAHRVIVCPAFPGTGRTVYQGHLFVTDRLLSESGMQDHPLTPMTDPDIRRWLAPQTRHTVGHVAAPAVLAGRAAIRAVLDAQHAAGHRLIVVDAMRDADLIEIGAAATGLPLVTGGSGVAQGLPAVLLGPGVAARPRPSWRSQPGRCVVLAGSCSRATQAQVARHAALHPARAVDPDDVVEGRLSSAALAEWLLVQPGVPMAYSTGTPDAVAAAQVRHGRERVAGAVEAFFADLARRLVDGGAGAIVVAGGETSGAVVEGLRIQRLEIGPEIDPGVPAMRAGDSLTLALKSGNFGGPDFFEKAARVLSGEAP